MLPAQVVLASQGFRRTCLFSRAG